MAHEIHFDKNLLARYDKSGPRYTSYPTAVQFTDSFDETVYRELVASNRETSRQRPLSLYFHIPFCNTVCFYCGCNKIVTANRRRAQPYLDVLYQEIAMQAELFDRDRPVTQLHWGGGTPTFISHGQMTDLMATTHRYFNLLDDDSGEYSIEIDPREVRQDTLTLLRELGFNRMSLGVQDFNPDVQKAVNRIQPEETTIAVLQEARKQGFRSINLDLIYGLPRQSIESFAETLDKIVTMEPDRLSVFNYAHLPKMFKTQRQINEAELPSAEEKLAILGMTIERLTAAGYVYIGMDHFARPDDELAQAQRQGSLYRNFQGYSTHADCDLLAMGVTSISKIANSYSQNQRAMDDYVQAVEHGHLPVMRGIILDDDDLLRREIITQLICHHRLDTRKIEETFAVSFENYFENELKALQQFVADELLVIDDNLLEITPLGKLLVRNICMVFDRYWRDSPTQRYSRVI
ncbi:MAG: oxygen-independent coproporphyrinogen III oxidase [Gammaproteobacteria bacterium]|nr:MAG: oxygen-independent coproporphyrinogen III oxidase [Gammaproteobacteria bacterium]